MNILRADFTGATKITSALPICLCGKLCKGINLSEARFACSRAEDREGVLSRLLIYDVSVKGVQQLGLSAEAGKQLAVTK